MQVEEKTKLACQPDGFYGPLTERELVVSAAEAFFLQLQPLPYGQPMPYCCSSKPCLVMFDTQQCLDSS